MAHVTTTPDAPRDISTVLVGNAEFDGGEFDTEDRAVIAFAQASPYFEADVPTEQTAPDAVERDPNDPHANVSADHLSSEASDAAVEAADSNESKIREVARSDVGAPEPANVSEAVRGALHNAGVDEDAQLPEGAQASTRTTSPAPAEAPSTERSERVPDFAGGDN